VDRIDQQGASSMSHKLTLTSIHWILTATAASVALCGTAFAADLSLRSASVYTPPPIFTWTGFYIGGQIGYEWGTSSTTATNYATGTIAAQPDYNASGLVGGVHSGYNYQINQFVIGYESAINGSSYQGSGLNNSGTVLHSTNLPFESSLRGRVGIAWDRTLVFAAGGLALGRLQNTSLNTMNGFSDRFNNTNIGWTVGGGIEHAITNNWSVRAEYLYTNYGNINEFEAFSTGGIYSVTKHETDNKVQIGFSYKFDKPLLQMARGLLHGN
jgi:outer membrane immunogenic protein